ncbi:gag-protease polyprotein [Trifolium repens]|nr:gag-protease polyprotein [Trifolium repens]
MKVTTIEEAQDIASLKVEEVVGSLQSFERNFCDKIEKKGKSIAFASNTDSKEADNDLDTREDISKEIVLLGKQFNKILKRVERRPRRNVQHIQPNISKQGNTSAKSMTDEDKGIQCFECEGYGHIKTECATYLKKQKKGLAVTWSDEDNSNNELENVTANHVSTTTGVCFSDRDTCDDEFIYEELASMDKDLYLKSEELCRIFVEQKYHIKRLRLEKQELQDKVISLQEEIKQLSFNLESMTKSVRMMCTGTKKLNEILSIRNHLSDPTRVGYGKTHNKETTQSNFVPAQKGFNIEMMLPHPAPHQRHMQNKKFTTIKCHYCGKNDHRNPPAISFMVIQRRNLNPEFIMQSPEPRMSGSQEPKKLPT